MSRAKSVLFICAHYLPHLGGVETHVKEVSEELKGRFDISVLTQTDEKDLSLVVLNGVSVYRFRYPKIKYVGLFVIWVKMFKYIPLFFNADIVHIHDVSIWFLPFRFIFFWKKVFITFHGWEGVYPIPWKSTIQKQIGAIFSNGYICVGEYLCKFYRIKPDLFVYGGVKESRIGNTLKKDKQMLIFLGRLSQDTGASIVAESLIKLNKYEVVFCGDGELRSECETIGSVRGFVKNPRRYLSRACICIAGGYLSALESLASGCVTVVVAQNVARRQIFMLSPFIRWLVVVKNTQELVNFLARKEAVELASKRVASAGIWAREQTWSRVAETYLSLWLR